MDEFTPPRTSIVGTDSILAGRRRWWASAGLMVCWSAARFFFLIFCGYGYLAVIHARNFAEAGRPPVTYQLSGVLFTGLAAFLSVSGFVIGWRLFQDRRRAALALGRVTLILGAALFWLAVGIQEYYRRNDLLEKSKPVRSDGSEISLQGLPGLWGRGGWHGSV